MWALLYIVFALSATAWALHIKRSRTWVFMFMLLSLLVLGFINQGCLCSVGATQNVIARLLGSASAGIPLTALLLFLVPLIASMFWGRVFCGGVCPLGGMQDVVNVARIKVPRWLDNTLKVIPLTILAVVIIAIIRGDGFLLCKYDFIVPFFRFNATGVLLFIGLGGILLSMVFARPFCRYACPYGTLLGAASLIAKRQVDISPESCVKCSFCGEICLVDAIEKPAELGHDESKISQKIWFIFMILLLPLWTIGFSEAGSRAAVPSKIVERIEKLQSLEKRSEKVEVKLTEARVVAQESSQKGRVVGALFGILWGGYLIHIIRRKKHEVYKADKTRCVSCARCYNHCPQGSPKGKEPHYLDRIFGHLRHRLKENKKGVSKALATAAIILGVALLGLGGTLINNELTLSKYSVMKKQDDLKELRKQVKEQPENGGIHAAYLELEDLHRSKYLTAGQNQRPTMVLFVITLILFTTVLKYRHNRYVLKTIPLKVDKTPHTLRTTILSRLGIITLGIGIIVTVFQLFPKVL